MARGGQNCEPLNRAKRALNFIAPARHRSTMFSTSFELHTSMAHSSEEAIGGGPGGPCDSHGVFPCDDRSHYTEHAAQRGRRNVA